MCRRLNSKLLASVGLCCSQATKPDKRNIEFLRSGWDVQATSVAMSNLNQDVGVCSTKGCQGQGTCIWGPGSSAEGPVLGGQPKGLPAEGVLQLHCVVLSAHCLCVRAAFRSLPARPHPLKDHLKESFLLLIEERL